MAVTQAFRPIALGCRRLNNCSQAFGGSCGAEVAAAMSAIKPFAAGGVIGTPAISRSSPGSVAGGPDRAICSRAARRPAQVTASAR
jgi:hypothetical protein